MILPVLLLGVAGDKTALPSISDIVAKMVARDSERQAALHGYTSTRRYVLTNRTLSKRAEMVVRMICHADGSKKFDIVEESGWGGARKYVFRRLLNAEMEAAQPDLREQSRITPRNYTFQMVGAESLGGRPAYVLAIEPKTSNKYLTRGRIWIDADDYAVVRVEGTPAKKPSFWIKSVHFVHEYTKTGNLWFPVSDHSVTDVRILGTTEMTIEYFDYKVAGAELSTASQ